MDERQRELLLSACDAIVNADDEEMVAMIILWPDPAKPGGVGSIILPEGNGQKREAECGFFLAENEAEARHIHALINAAGPWPIVPLGQ
jgi:hypothetical protein